MKNINDIKEKTEKNLANSLTAENVRLIPFLPYLLQDLWDLGTPSEDIITLLEKNIFDFKNFKVIDLACGKGAVSIPLVKKLKIPVTMVDFFPEFIQTAKKKAIEYDVYNLCTFKTEDISKTLMDETGKDWNCVIFCAAGDILGDQKETISKLKKIIAPEGYIILDGNYIAESNSDDIRYKSQDYITYDEWMEIFDKEEIEIVDSILDDNKEEDNEKNELNMKLIANRVNELSKKYPENKELFESYLQSQLNEIHDLYINIISPIWLLKIKRKNKIIK